MAISLNVTFINLTDTDWIFQNPNSTHGTDPSGGDIPPNGKTTVSAKPNDPWVGPSPVGTFEYLWQGTTEARFGFSYKLHDADSMCVQFNPDGMEAIISSQGEGYFEVTIKNGNSSTPMCSDGSDKKASSKA